MEAENCETRPFMVYSSICGCHFEVTIRKKHETKRNKYEKD